MSKVGTKTAKRRGAGLRIKPKVASAQSVRLKRWLQDLLARQMSGVVGQVLSVVPGLLRRHYHSDALGGIEMAVVNQCSLATANYPSVEGLVENCKTLSR